MTVVIAGHSSAREFISLYLEDEPIYTSSAEESPGFLMEIVMEMSKRIDISLKVNFLPWKRAQEMTIHSSNAVIFPLTRTEAREPNYRWVCKVFDVPVMFINKKGSPLINSVEDAQQLRKFAVIAGTPQEEQVKKWGLDKYASVKGKDLYQLLAEDKLQAIYTARPEAAYAWKNLGYKETLQYGATLQTLSLWIAASKESDKIDSDQWIAALEEIKKTGFYDKTFEKYFGD